MQRVAETGHPEPGWRAMGPVAPEAALNLDPPSSSSYSSALGFQRDFCLDPTCLEVA